MIDCNICMNHISLHPFCKVSTSSLDCTYDPCFFSLSLSLPPFLSFFPTLSPFLFLICFSSAPKAGAVFVSFVSSVPLSCRRQSSCPGEYILCHWLNISASVLPCANAFSFPLFPEAPLNVTSRRVSLYSHVCLSALSLLVYNLSVWLTNFPSISLFLSVHPSL